MIWKRGLVLPYEKLGLQEKEQIKTELNNVQAVALTAWSEARSRLERGKGWVPNPIDAMVDIINVIDNRAKAKGVRHKDICHQRRQFSCWDSLGGEQNYKTILDQAQRLLAGQAPTGVFEGCLAMAAVFVAGDGHDQLDTATHYYAPASMLPPGRVPDWAAPPAVFVVERYGHRFYKAVRW